MGLWLLYHKISFLNGGTVRKRVHRSTRKKIKELNHAKGFYASKKYEALASYEKKPTPLAEEDREHSCQGEVMGGSGWQLAPAGQRAGGLGGLLPARTPSLKCHGKAAETHLTL